MSKKKEVSATEAAASRSKKRDKAAEAAKAVAARETETLLGPPDDADAEENDGDEAWFATGGLRFAIDSNTAYQIDAARNNLEVRDPLKNRRIEEDPKFQMRKRPNAHEDGPRQVARW